jgi:hypothetical protein
LAETVNNSCVLDIHKRFFISNILSISGEKSLQHFARDDDEILALKSWTYHKNMIFLHVNQQVTFGILIMIH